jgi:hypothetical protein
LWDKEGNLVDLGEGAELAGFQELIIKPYPNTNYDLDAIIKYELT